MMRIDGKLRVLVVEDDRADFLLAKRALDAMPGWSCEVQWARNGEQGHAALCSGDHELCLCDYELGPELGTSVIRRARERNVRIPILLLTGQDCRTVDLAGMKAGASQFLAKDQLQPHSLERAIRYALQHHAQQERLSRLALRDSLTGLLNRAGFERHLQDLQAADGRIEPHVGLMYVDLDRFKSVNDEHGHTVGDRLLVAVGQRIRAELGPADAAGRIGGDEFAIVTREDTSWQWITTLSERLQTSFELPYDLGLDAPLYCTASLGVASSTTGCVTPEALLVMADQAMYDAKGSRREARRSHAL